MKILLYTTNLLGGGAQKITVNLANYYNKINHDVYVLASNTKGPFYSDINPEINIIDLKHDNS